MATVTRGRFSKLTGVLQLLLDVGTTARVGGNHSEGGHHSESRLYNKDGYHSEARWAP